MCSRIRKILNVHPLSSRHLPSFQALDSSRSPVVGSPWPTPTLIFYSIEGHLKFSLQCFPYKIYEAFVYKFETFVKVSHLLWTIELEIVRPRFRILLFRWNFLEWIRWSFKGVVPFQFQGLQEEGGGDDDNNDEW